MARFEAFRKIMGLTGHGFSLDNMLAYPDTLNERLKLITHRDNNYAPLLDTDFFEKQLITWTILRNKRYTETQNLLFKNLLISDSIRLKSYKYIVNTYNQKTKKSLQEAENFHNDLITEPLPYKLFHVENGTKKNRFRTSDFPIRMINNNMDIIMSALNSNYPIINYSLSDSNFQMIILPRSISEISIENFIITGNIKSSINVKLLVKKNREILNDIEFSANNIAEYNSKIKGYLNQITYFDNITEDGIIDRSNYTIDLRFSGKISNHNLMKIRLFNNTTKKKIPIEKITCEYHNL